MQPARHEEVARALGRRAGHDRRLDLEVALVGEEVADLLHHRVAQDHVVAHPLLAQVEVAVAEAELLADRVVLVDLEGRRLASRRAARARPRRAPPRRSGSSGLIGALVAAHELAAHADHVLAAEPAGRGVRLGRLLGPEHELEQPGPVAQVDEDQPAVVAAAVHPAGHAHLLAHVVRRAAGRPSGSGSGWGAEASRADHSHDVVDRLGALLGARCPCP